MMTLCKQLGSQNSALLNLGMKISRTPRREEKLCSAYYECVRLKNSDRLAGVPLLVRFRRIR